MTSHPDLAARNKKLAELLKASRDQLDRLSAEVDALSEPASSYGVYLQAAPSRSDGMADAEIFTSNRRLRVKVSPALDPADLESGMLVRLGEGHIVVEPCGYPSSGQLTTVQERLGDDRAIIITPSGEEHVVGIAKRLRSEVRAGDTVVTDLRAGIAMELVEKTDLTQLSLEEVPSVTFDDIGGLDSQISQIRDAVELPFLHPDLYREYDLHPPKGVLLYGPPGCGKTLIAKAVAHSLAQQEGFHGESYFLNVKGPELLNKFVGETERRIRLIFERARELAGKGNGPVVVFFDEMESIFRTRGSGVSSDTETTVVPQLLAELDGVEDLRNVIVIGATNREELIDPAIMRPGRLDVKIRINRPDEAGTREILAHHLTDTVPVAEDRTALIDAATTAIFADHPFARLALADGSSLTLHYRDFVSGAMLANIVSRAKKLAIKEEILGRTSTSRGITRAHLLAAIEAEQAESEHLPTSTNPQEWSKIIGAGRGGRVVTGVELVAGEN